MNRRKSGYRSGIVLGFSVAESFLLIVFILILLLSLLMGKNSESEKELAKLKLELTSLQNIKDKLKSTGDLSNEEIDNFFNELVEARQEAERLENLYEKVEEKVEVFEDLKKVLLDKSGVKDSLSEKEVKELIEKAVRETSFIAEAEKTTGPDTFNEAISELRVCKGQIENLQAQLKTEGKGFAFPPCLVSEDGSPEYLYDVAVTDEGMLVKENDLTKQLDTIDRTILTPVITGSDVPPTTFTNMTSPLYEYSRKNNCRFFIRLYDNTGATKKLVYKKHRRFVEGHFYILDKKDRSLK